MYGRTIARKYQKIKSHLRHFFEDQHDHFFENYQPLLFLKKPKKPFAKISVTLEVNQIPCTLNWLSENCISSWEIINCSEVSMIDRDIRITILFKNQTDATTFQLMKD